MADFKKCTACKEVHPVAMFGRKASASDGLNHWCKPCKAVKKKAEYEANKGPALARMAAYRKANPDKVKATQKACYKKNKEHYSAKGKADYLANREARLAYSAKYCEENKEAKSARDRAYVAKRMKEDALFRLSYSVRNRIFIALRRKNFKKSSKTADMLGCDFEFLQLFIEEQFQPGMSWEDRSAWHVDHKIPLASATTAEEMEKLCHFSNLRPMWATDNIRKGARMNWQ